MYQRDNDLPLNPLEVSPMLTLSATDLAIAIAAKAGTLTVTECEGRFGAYWAIEDDHGVIEVALSAEEAAERVKACS